MARKSNMRAERNLFYIVTNGKETEQNYFSLLKAYQSPYDVKVVFHNSDPVDLVVFASKFCASANQVWVVFDVDLFHLQDRLKPAMILARQIGVKCAVSNVSFEVWILSHFMQCRNTYTQSQLEDIISEYINKQGCSSKYSKADKEQMKKYILKSSLQYKTAITNAKIVYQTKQMDAKQVDGLDPIWDWCSCTSVYKLVEALRLKK